MINDKRQFKEIGPDKPIDHRLGNTFASKPEAEKQTQTLTIYVTEAEKKQCEAAAKRRDIKLSTWARIILCEEADNILDEPYDEQKKAVSPNKT